MEPSSQIPEASTPEFRDRRTGLIVAGILQILMGALCVLFVPLLIVGQVMSARMNAGEAQYRMILPAVAVYAILAAIFILLGIASIRGRRWARAFSLILGWSWLVMGIVGVLVYAVMLPKLLMSGAPGFQGLPESAKVVMVVVALTFMGLFFVLVPGGMVLFYRSKHVKATCELRDPVTRWTDRCPLPVLGLSTWLFLGGVCMLLMPAVYHAVAPFFGILISGFPGLVYYVGIAGLFLYLAQATYRLSMAAWWIVLATGCLFGVSNLITFARVDLMEMYRLMGYPEAQIRQFEQFSFLQHDVMLWCSALGFVPLFGYLFYVRKFFRRTQVDEGLPA